MQNKERWFTKKKGAMLVLTLCLVGTAAATYYAMDLSEDRAKEEYMVDLNEEALDKETEAEAAAAPDVQAEFPDGATEMDVDPATLLNPAEQQFAGEKMAADGTIEPEADARQEQEGEETELASAKEDADVTEETEEQTEAAHVMSSGVEAVHPTVSFAASEQLQWPVAGTVLMDYSMNAAVYFATLDQYKYNPALVLAAEEGAQVVSAAKGIIDRIVSDEETGTTICMNLGDGYELVYGQLKEVTVSEGDVVEPGQLLGYVSEPTKYYCEEGANLYFAMKKDGAPEDPFLYLE